MASPPEGLVARRIPAGSVLHRLALRQMFGCGYRRAGSGCRLNTDRGFHTNIFPNFTLVNVEKPPCFLRKFSPDGKMFIAFSSDQTSLEIYEYLGPAAAGDLLAGCPGEQLGEHGEQGQGQPEQREREQQADHQRIRATVFSRFFRLKHTVSVSPCHEQLNRECSLFTDNGRYVIVGSACLVPEEPHAAMYNIYRNNESVSPNPRNPLEDYTLHIVDMVEGKLCDKTYFKIDKIFLSHNQGLYLYGDTLAVLSVQHQTIHIFIVDSATGSFLKLREIGRNCNDNDDFLMSPVLSAANQSSLPNPPVYRHYKEATINLLKHRILVFLYKRAQALSEQDGNPYELRNFYKYFEQVRWLRMWKMQLLDANHLLIKYASEDVVTGRISEPNSQPSYFVVYNIESTEVLAVYENTSTELLDLFENFCDLFRNACLSQEDQFTSSPSNNIYAALIQQRFKQTIVSAKNGGSNEARKRVLAQLPISAQSYSPSPFLDLSLFSYDDKWVSVMERPKACGEHPIRFYGRECGLLKFKIYAGVQGRNPPPQARRLVAFTFHPTDPFAISVQRTNLEYVVNFHVRHDAQS